MKPLLQAIQDELAESFDLAETQLVSEQIAGNVVKEEFWKGELSALHRMRRIVDESTGAPIPDPKE